jgi:6-phosphogluconolactonase
MRINKAARAALAIVAATSVASLAQASDTEREGAGAGAVFTLTNRTDQNAVAIFSRGGDGTLTAAGSVLTGGKGTGTGLGNQGALALDNEGRSLFAVDAGSNEISAFSLRGTRLTETAHVASGGVRPVSITAHDGLVYVVNAGNATTPGGIQGFRLGERGSLTPIPGSARPLSAAAVGPAQISFDPEGETLVVTEKATNTIDTYTVGEDGVASAPVVHASAAQTPFGFAFDRRGTLIVSDAVGGAPGGAGLSSYRLRGTSFTTVTAFAGDTETAACWVVTAGRFAFATNTGSGNVSSYAVGRDGGLTLASAIAGTTGAGPIDAAATRNQRFLYTLDGAAHGISAFQIGANGSLSAIPGVLGLPIGANGLVAT